MPNTPILPDVPEGFDVQPEHIMLALLQIRDAVNLQQLGRDAAAFTRDFQIACDLAADSKVLDFPQAITYLSVVNPDRILTISREDGGAPIGTCPVAKTTTMRIPTTRKITVSWPAAGAATKNVILVSSLPIIVWTAS